MFRWRLEIADFEVLGGQLKFEYKKGLEHKVADCLSRNPVDPQIRQRSWKTNGW